jgi:endonuclease YncB( thermonuclease family)
LFAAAWAWTKGREVRRRRCDCGFARIFSVRMAASWLRASHAQNEVPAFQRLAEAKISLAGKRKMIVRSLALALLLACPAAAKPMRVLSVHDGDTITVEGQWAVMDGRKVALRIPGRVNIRLLATRGGIDTPEIGAKARCALEGALADRARDNLRALIAAGGGMVDIRAAKHDKYGGRLLANPTVAARSLGDAQIAGGFAVAYDGIGPRHDWCAGMPEKLLP